MEVMQTAEFESDAVLIGQIGETTSFRVSDDPMLMSMLSTGFYQNPIKTMTQEILFNAWDAHHMGNCIDRPIEIYISEGSGLIIRDFGPGIPEDAMNDIYCVYGSSTKRKDNRQTGGFGLGSKSPYAYTDSFTVTSMNQGKKSIYLMVRVSEKTGKPAMTKIMESPTDETGLMVTIPLKNEYDLALIKRHLPSILKFSGIKAILTGEGIDAPILFDDKTPEPGEVIFVPNNSITSHPIKAIYGGVKYDIESFDEFASDYKFLELFTEHQIILIGFPPNSLTPLPNREGLNMNTTTKEIIKTMLEKIADRVRQLMEPLMKVLAKAYMDAAFTAELQPIFALTGAFSFSNYRTIIDTQKSFDQIIAVLNLTDSDNKFIQIIRIMLDKDPRSLNKFIEPDVWKDIVIKTFLNLYPTEIEMATSYKTAMLKSTTFSNNENHFAKQWNQKVLEKLYTFQTLMRTEYSNDSTLWPAFRFGDNTQVWQRIHLHKVDKEYQFHYTSDRDPTFGSVNLKYPLLDSTVLLGKNTFCLRDTILSYDSFFNIPFDNYTLYQNINKADTAACIGIVVYPRKDAYTKAMKILEDMNFEIIIANEPHKKIVSKSKDKTNKTTKESYPKLISDMRQMTDGTLIQNPTHMLYITKANINSDYSRHKPDSKLIEIITSRFPNTVWINNSVTAEKLEKKGVIRFENALKTWFDSLVIKQSHFRNIVRAIKLAKSMGYHYNLIEEPIIHKALGMVPIKPENKESFWEEFNEYNTLVNSSYYIIKDLQKEIERKINQFWYTDPMRDQIIKNLEIFNFFDPYRVNSLIKENSSDRKKAILLAISHFIKKFKS